jgi:hypothetical protein
MDLVSFTQSNLFSKKQFLFHDNDVKYAKIPLHILNISSVINMYNCSKNINIVNKIICLSLSTYIADFITALFHCYHIDRQVFNKSDIYMNKTNKKIVINTTSGYSSGHHIFPSNWKDIDDIIIMRDTFISLTPLFILNHFNSSDEIAYLNYAILYQLVISGISHKYAHEKNHNRYVPKLIKVLQDLRLLLSGKKHKKHHEKLNCNYSFLNGLSDEFANILIKKIDELFNIKPYEEVIDLCKKYLKKYGKDITIQFVGDIEGEIVVNLDGNILTLSRPP